MADHGIGQFRPLAYTPGNPEFPTLPDGIPTPHVSRGGLAPGLSARRVPVNTLSKKSADTSDVAGWYFNGIWRQPIPVDFATITQPKQRTLTVTNSFRTNQQLTAVDLSAFVGLTLVSPGLPVTIEPFDTITLTFEAATLGDDSFDADALLTVGGVVLPVRMIGRRIVVFNAAPQRPIVERMSWLTDNMIAVSGKEQAFSLRHAPRSLVTIEQRIVSDVIRTRLLNQMQASGFLRAGVQSWWQSREVNAAIASVDTVIQVDTENMEIAAGDEVSLVSPDYSAVVQIEVDSFTLSTITATQPIGTAFPARTSVMPVRLGFAKNTIDQATFAKNVQDVRVSFDLIEYDAIGAIDVAYFATHPVDSRPIITAPLYFSGQSRADKIVNRINVLDGGTGDLHAEQREPLGRPAQPLLVLCEDMAAQHAWRRFLHYVRGSWGVFYVPTGTNDLPLKDPLVLGTNTFTIPNMGVAQLLGNQAPRRDIEIVVAGVSYYRRITNVADVPTEEVITINSIIPGVGSVAASDVRVSWLTPSRIVGDTATFIHLRRGFSELRFQVRGVIE